MKDSELNQILKSAAVPEPAAERWDQFPKRVMAQIHRREQPAGVEKGAEARVRAESMEVKPPAWAFALRFKPALALGLAVVCIALGFALGFWKGRDSAITTQQLAQAKKYFKEVEALFPNQVQAIVFDDRGAHLVLADEANVPASLPVYLKISGPKGRQTCLTFSGQQVRINGDICDVLVDHHGDVLLVGQQLVWSSAQPASKTGRYQIEARTLETNS
jgi:hypothetical protein